MTLEETIDFLKGIMNDEQEALYNLDDCRCDDSLYGPERIVWHFNLGDKKDFHKDRISALKIAIDFLKEKVANGDL